MRAFIRTLALVTVIAVPGGLLVFTACVLIKMVLIKPRQPKAYK